MFCVVPTYSDLAAERHQLTASLQESHRLTSQVDHLGTQLDQVNGEKQKVEKYAAFCLSFLQQLKTKSFKSFYNYR